MRMWKKTKETSKLALWVPRHTSVMARHNYSSLTLNVRVIGLAPTSKACQTLDVKPRDHRSWWNGLLQISNQQCKHNSRWYYYRRYLLSTWWTNVAGRLHILLMIDLFMIGFYKTVPPLCRAWHSCHCQSFELNILGLNVISKFAVYGGNSRAVNFKNYFVQCLW